MSQKLGYQLTIILFSIIFTKPCFASSTYTFEDLKVLEAQRAYSEFYRHALDIKPSERNADWESMMESMGSSLIKTVQEQKIFNQTLFTILKTISSWPYYKNNELFIEKRDNVFLKYLNNCFSSTPDQCFASSEDLFYNYQHEFSYSFKLVTLMAQKNIPHLKLWPYIEKSTQNKMSEFYCHQSEVINTISANIYNEIQTKKKNSTIHKDCLKFIIPKFREKLNSSDQTDRLFAYTFLKMNKMITQDEEVKFNIKAYLSDALKSNSEIDKTMISFKKLGENYKLRESFSKELNKNEPLPDLIFASKENANVKSRVLYRYFPEFFDLYAKKCLSYLAGEESYAHGNPTPNCHAFFNVNKNVLPDSFKNKYQKMTSFMK